MVYKKGQSGNPKGRLKDAEASLLRSAAAKSAQEYFGPHVQDAVATIKEIMATGKEPNRLRAAEIIIERVYGKAPQQVELKEIEQLSLDELEAQVKELFDKHAVSIDAMRAEMH